MFSNSSYTQIPWTPISPESSYCNICRRLIKLDVFTNPERVIENTLSHLVGKSLCFQSFNSRVRTHHWIISKSSSSHAFTLLFLNSHFTISLLSYIPHIISAHEMYTKEQKACTVKAAIFGTSRTKEFLDAVIFRILERDT